MARLPNSDASENQINAINFLVRKMSMGTTIDVQAQRMVDPWQITPKAVGPAAQVSPSKF